jgi:nicotinamide-nucleotide adenylyltransferase
MHDIGVIHGRFQVLHNDHMVYLLAGKKLCRHLVIGITNPEPELTAPEAVDPNRSSPEANPFTYFERYRMVYGAMREAGVGAGDFSVVPFPINFPERYKYYVPMKGVYFLTIYDGWGEKKLQMFESLGLQTEILWRRDLGEKGLSSTEIRELIRTGQPWESLVPESVSLIIKKLKKIV